MFPWKSTQSSSKLAAKIEKQKQIDSFHFWHSNAIAFSRSSQAFLLLKLQLWNGELRVILSYHLKICAFEQLHMLTSVLLTKLGHVKLPFIQFAKTIFLFVNIARTECGANRSRSSAMRRAQIKSNNRKTYFVVSIINAILCSPVLLQKAQELLPAEARYKRLPNDYRQLEWSEFSCASFAEVFESGDPN